MRLAHDVATVRAAERALMATLPDGTLMQRAAAGLASVCADLLDGVYGARVVVLAGGGDNGGDAMLAGEILARRGARVDVIRSRGDRLGDAECGDLLARAALVVDGLVGIGAKPPLRGDEADLVQLLREHAKDAWIVAVDLASGVDPDSGECDGECVDADVTVTFGTIKPAALVDPGAEHAGVVRLVDIGLADYLGAPVLEALQASDVQALLPQRERESDKYARGVVGVLAGSAAYPGAAVLSVAGAVRSGAGYVRVAAIGDVAEVVRAAHPEAVVTTIQPGDHAAVIASGRVQARVIGPGMGTDDDARALLAGLLADDIDTVIDADGLSLLVDNVELVTQRTARTILTPHAGELARLLGVERVDIERRRLHFVRQAAKQFKATVLLKGSTTLVADPGDSMPVRVNPTGTSWLATAGSGDVLSGVIGNLLAAGLAPRDAASVGAFIHGLAGRLAAIDGPPTAPDVAAALPRAIAAVDDIVAERIQ